MIFGLIFPPELVRKAGMEVYDFCEGIVTSIADSHCEYVEPFAELFVTDGQVFGDYSYAEGWIGDQESTPELRDEEFIDAVAQVVVFDSRYSQGDLETLLDRATEGDWRDDFDFTVDRSWLLEGFSSYASDPELVLRYAIYALNAESFDYDVFYIDNEDGIEQYTVVVLSPEGDQGGELIIERLLPRLEEANEEIIVH